MGKEKELGCDSVMYILFELSLLVVSPEHFTYTGWNNWFKFSKHQQQMFLSTMCACIVRALRWSNIMFLHCIFIVIYYISYNYCNIIMSCSVPTAHQLSYCLSWMLLEKNGFNFFAKNVFTFEGNPPFF